MPSNAPSQADAIHLQNPNSVGAVQVIGYAIECSLKALLQKRGIPYPTSGPRFVPSELATTIMEFTSSEARSSELSGYLAKGER
ncbi:MAG: hypothetical protein EBE86_026990 [Hormoscilla sp. GUM202]|nr:hypothetical protein [Hormoscilla sp. GUM202]